MRCFTLLLNVFLLPVFLAFFLTHALRLVTGEGSDLRGCYMHVHMSLDTM